MNLFSAMAIEGCGMYVAYMFIKCIKWRNSMETVVDNIDSSEVEAEESLKKEYLYHLESPVTQNRADRFLEAFEVVLKHTNYRAVFDTYARSSTKCGRCSVTCPVYMVTQDPRDIP